MAGTEVSAAVSGKMHAMSGKEKKTLKWVMAGSSRDMSYMENGYQYVIRSGDKEYTLLQKTRSGEINRRQVCATKRPTSWPSAGLPRAANNRIRV